jgi:hypothetical protein
MCHGEIFIWSYLSYPSIIMHGTFDIPFLVLACVEMRGATFFGLESFSHGASQKGVLWPLPTMIKVVEEIHVKDGAWVAHS